MIPSISYENLQLIHRSRKTAKLKFTQSLSIGRNLLRPKKNHRLHGIIMMPHIEDDLAVFSKLIVVHLI